MGRNSLYRLRSVDIKRAINSLLNIEMQIHISPSVVQHVP